MWKQFVDYITYDILSLDGHLADIINFFIYDTVKILFLLIVIIFVIAFLRTYINTNAIHTYLQNKSLLVGNFLASLLGIITPFCSCSAVPLFLGFVQARIPLGITFSFLISSPMNNEIAIVLLFSLFGWKIALLYIVFGVIVSTLGGYIIEKLHLDKYVLIQNLEQNTQNTQIKQSLKQKIINAWIYTKDLFIQIYPYVFVGVGIGAFIHGYVPTELITTYAGENNPFAVILAVLAGIPMYSNSAGVIPMIEVLTDKGMLLGTALAFMMAITALSLPEAMILKKILHTRLILIFFGIVGAGIVCIGYIFNAIL